MIHRSSPTRSIYAHIRITHVLRVHKQKLSVVSHCLPLGPLGVFQDVKNDISVYVIYVHVKNP